MQGAAYRDVSGDLEGPPPPRFRGTVAAHANGTISTQLHYTGGMGEQRPPRLSADGGEFN